MAKGSSGVESMLLWPKSFAVRIEGGIDAHRRALRHDPNQRRTMQTLTPPPTPPAFPPPAPKKRNTALAITAVVVGGIVAVVVAISAVVILKSNDKAEAVASDEGLSAVEFQDWWAKE